MTAAQLRAARENSHAGCVVNHKHNRGLMASVECSTVYELVAEVDRLRAVMRELCYAASDLAYCHADPDPPKACGTCFGCHLTGAMHDAERALGANADIDPDAARE